MADKKENKRTETEIETELSEKVEKKNHEDKKAAKKPSADELLAKIAELEATIAEKDDIHLRMAAEYDNFRRRSREEREAIYTDAVADTVSELLPIIDNLERASLYEDGNKVKEGLVMTVKAVETVFAKLKVEAVGAKGETFDPNLHNAVLHEDNEEFGEGEITEVFQKGYKKGSKIIRFAMVKTAN